MKTGWKGLVWSLVLGSALVLAGCCGWHGPRGHHAPRCADCPMHAGPMAGKAMAPAEAGQRQDILYVCDCGADCHCNSVSTTPGNCACGKPMRAYHIVKIEGDEALLCTCGANCRCAIDPADSSKCGCGKPVKRVSLKGTGIYFCNCGGSCTCNTVSAQPGPCKCGMALKKVD